MSNIIKATDVFKPQGVPTFTLVKDFGNNFESSDCAELDDGESSNDFLPSKIELFNDAIDEKGKLIRVVGPSKSGKTVFVTTMAEYSTIVRVSASGISNARELWQRILSVLGKAYDSLISTEVAGKVGGEATTKAATGIIFAKVEGEAKLVLEGSFKKISEKLKHNDPINSLIENVANEKIWIFIDDFHYASEHVQRELAEQIKFASEEGVQFILALIPGRSEDILKKNDDLRGRIIDIKFSYWEIKKLELIATSGFPLLGIKLEPGTAKKLAIEAAGSPQLMQSICLNIARDLGAREGKFDPPLEPDITNNLMGKVCVKIASSGIDYSSTIEEMKKGPLTRGRDRKIYKKADGSELDIYHLIVEGLAIDPPTLKFSDKDLLNRVESLVNVKVSNYWDSVRHISQIANKQGSEMKIDFGEELRWVTILDPYLLFALRWSK